MEARTNTVAGAVFPARDGNTFTPLIDILPTYRAICAAADAAQRSVWVVISFIDVHWALPDKRGLCFDYLERLAHRGLDVRVLAWNNPSFYSGGFLRADAALPQLQARRSALKVRWDFSPDERHCHHEKTWIIDGATLLSDGAPDTCVGFTGGIVIGGPHTGPDHSHPQSLRHDIFASLTGPAATDLVRSFVQRWNGARGPGTAPVLCYPDATVANALPYPVRTSAFRPGTARCQVLRTVCRNHYSDLPDGEDSIYRAYAMAIGSAQKYIYIENQHLAHEGLLGMIVEAMNRGVLVLYLVPGDKGIVSVLRAEKDAIEAWSKDKSLPRPWYAGLFLDTFPRLAQHPNFVLCGVREHGSFIYVHSKLMIVDDEWLTLGSANFVDISFEKDHTEVNVACWDAPTARSLRHSLLCEHRKLSGSAAQAMEEDGRAAVAVAMQEARSNAVLLAQDVSVHDRISGRLIAIDPRTYGASAKSASPPYKVRYP